MGRLVPVNIDAALPVVRHTPERLIESGFAAWWAAPRGAEGHDVRPPGPTASVSRPVRVGLGPTFEEDGALVVAVWWEAVEHPRLFPAFDGGFELRAAGQETELRLVGSYEPPLGMLGRFADGVVGHRLVTSSLAALLAAAAERLAAAAA